MDANLRWLLPALACAACAGAWAVGNLRSRARRVAEAIVLVAIVLALGDAIEIRLRTVAAVAACGVAVVALAVAGLRGIRAGGRARVAGTVALALLAAAAVAVGHRRQERFDAGRYRDDPVTAVLTSKSTDADRVGLAGVWTVDGLTPVLPAFGGDLENEVSFVGEKRRGQLREYETRRQFLDAVRRGRYDLLVIGRGTAAYGPCAVPGRESDEDLWAREAGFALVAQTPRLSLYAPRVRG